MALMLEIRIEDEFRRLMRAIAYGAPFPITDEELIKRWISKGLTFETGKPEHEASAIVKALVSVQRK